MFEDFEFKLRKDSVFRTKIATSIVKLKNTYQDALKNPNRMKFHKEALMDYLKVSNFNLSPLLGFYFPAYPEGPFSLANFPFAHAYYTLNIGPGAYTVYRGSRQIGKSLSFNNLCKFRNKTTGNQLLINIGEFFDKAKKAKNP